MTKKKDDNTGLWVGLGVLTGLGLYLWLRPKKGASTMTETMPVPSTEPPLGYATLGAVQSRFDDLRDIYHMGKLTPEQAISQVNSLEHAVMDLRDRNVGDPMGAFELMGRLEDFKDEITDFIEFKKSLEVQP